MTLAFSNTPKIREKIESSVKYSALVIATVGIITQLLIYAITAGRGASALRGISFAALIGALVAVLQHALLHAMEGVEAPLIERRKPKNKKEYIKIAVLGAILLAAITLVLINNHSVNHILCPDVVLLSVLLAVVDQILPAKEESKYNALKIFAMHALITVAWEVMGIGILGGDCRGIANRLVFFLLLATELVETIMYTHDWRPLYASETAHLDRTADIGKRTKIALRCGAAALTACSAACFLLYLAAQDARVVSALGMAPDYVHGLIACAAAVLSIAVALWSATLSKQEVAEAKLAMLEEFNLVDRQSMSFAADRDLVCPDVDLATNQNAMHTNAPGLESVAAQGASTASNFEILGESMEDGGNSLSQQGPQFTNNLTLQDADVASLDSAAGHAPGETAELLTEIVLLRNSLQCGPLSKVCNALSLS